MWTDWVTKICILSALAIYACAANGGETCPEGDFKKQKNNPHMTERFNDTEIKWFCQRANSWNSRSLGEAGKPGPQGAAVKIPSW